MRLGKIKHIHFVGIGGAGMNGLAEIMNNLGYTVSGSDLIESGVTRKLRETGIDIYIGHKAKNIGSADVVIFSAAVPQENPELVEARKKRIPIIRRAVMLAELMRLKHGICIAGTHGKTTTTSIIGQILTAGNLDPTIVVGGKLKSLESHVRLGTGDFLVAEADEFNRSFLTLYPTFAVITTLEMEHSDTYEGLGKLQEAFIEFGSRVPFYGAVIACIDDPGVKEILPGIDRKIITYGTSKNAEYRPTDITFEKFESSFKVESNKRSLGYFSINLPGLHNIKNAVAAIAIGLELDIPVEIIRGALKDFAGVFRRFELKDEINDIMIVDDYAHHPTEVKASLNAARTGWKDRQIIAVFQPHLYSRTRDFSEEFGASFGNADKVIITDIYPAREKPIPGITGAIIVDSAHKQGHSNVEFIPDKQNVIDYLSETAEPGDIVITLGAGDVWDISERLILKLKKKTCYY
ncbi:MAG: UDP-N-acetylmuramate--L-alanine ligase [bacterium]|nr:UDP-N-acetylmuramate--L-alanine ligase [bacterium]